MESARRAAVEVTVGASVLASDAVVAVAGTARAVAAPVARALPRAPVPKAVAPTRLLGALQRRGSTQVLRSGTELSALLDRVVPMLLDQLLGRLDLTALILRYVDLDTVASRLDVDAVARRLDIEAVLDRVDVEAVVDRVDVNAVARRLDIEAVLDRLDLTQLVLQRVKLDVLVNAVLDGIDLAELAEEVIEEVDLAEIIRESTGAMASGTVRDARMQAILADQAVSRVRDRLRLRRGRRPDAVVDTEESFEAPIPAQRRPGR